MADGGTVFLDEIGEMRSAAAGQAPARPARSQVVERSGRHRRGIKSTFA